MAQYRLADTSWAAKAREGQEALHRRFTRFEEDCNLGIGLLRGSQQHMEQTCNDHSEKVDKVSLPYERRLRKQRAGVR